ncbi:MAG: hypothetical protein KC620_01415 [Myxococcales bacterium]|nr:hypothetical protein [Myxococcales bacterium]
MNAAHCAPARGPFCRARLALTCALLLVGCGPEDVPPLLDAGPDAESADAEAPADAAPIADAAAPPVDAAPRRCQWPADCPGGDCVDGICLNAMAQTCNRDTPCPDGQTCGGFAFGGRCAWPCELDGTCAIRPRPCTNKADCPATTNCKAGRCINDCVTDQDCEPGFCLEGECRPFPPVLDGDPPTPLGRPGQLYAGVGVVPLNYPIGVSMAGYGGRTGASTPYQKVLGGSDRVFETQDARALVLSTDDDLLIVLRMPLCFTVDYMRTLTAVKLRELTRSPEHPNGINYLDKLVANSTHSHSQPARYWNLLPGTGLGIFGHGEFSPEMANRYAESFARAVKAALDDLQPARFGWVRIDDFDPEGRIHSDRRGESPPYIDDRMMVWRIETLDGTPLAGVVNFAIHGTHMEETWITGDVAGAIEVIGTENLSAEAGRKAPVIFLNGNAGSVSPRGDDSVDVPWGKVQVVGHRVWPIFREAWANAVPSNDIDLEVLALRVPVTYDLLGYDRTVPDFRDPTGKPYIYGGFSCVTESRTPDDPYRDGALGCRLDLQTFIGHPEVHAHKSALAAFRIDNLIVTTLPGEPTSELGRRLSAEVEADARERGFQVLSVNLGYSQDHQLYLLEPNDWFLGGYEASQNWFGWNLGSYFAGHARALARQLMTPEKEDNETGIKPTWWPDLVDDTVPPTDTQGRAGRMVVQPPARLKRGDLIEARWVGGHPGVDQPWVVLERQVGSGFALVRRSPGLSFDNSGFESVTVYKGNYDDDHTWAARWELPFDFATGTYRLRFVGRVQSSGQIINYDSATSPFELEPARLAAYEVTVADRHVRACLTYPDGPSNDRGGAFGPLTPAGHLLRVDPQIRYDGPRKRWAFLLGQPLASPLVAVTVAGALEPTIVEAAPDAFTRHLVVARDHAGNEAIEDIPGWPCHRVEVALPGGGRQTVLVDDEDGNRAILQIEAVDNP